MRLRCFAFALCATGLYAQTKTVVENATVRVLDAVDRPHQKTALHKHDFNRVMIYLTPGDLDVTTEDGHTDHQHWKAGDVAWSAAGPLHVSENVGTADLRIIEIEVRKPAPGATPQRNPKLTQWRSILAQQARLRESASARLPQHARAGRPREVA